MQADVFPILFYEVATVFAAAHAVKWLKIFIVGHKAVQLSAIAADQLPVAAMRATRVTIGKCELATEFAGADRRVGIGGPLAQSEGVINCPVAILLIAREVNPEWLSMIMAIGHAQLRPAWLVMAFTVCVFDSD